MMFRQDSTNSKIEEAVTPATDEEYNMRTSTTRLGHQQPNSTAGQQQQQEVATAISSSKLTRTASPSSANNSQMATTNETATTPRKRAATRSKSEVLSPQVLQSLGPYDVLCGRCKKCYNNIGNRRFRLTITMNVPAYTIAKSTQDKRIIVQSILQSIKEAGGRCLRPTADGLIVFGDAEAQEKIGHALRDLVSTAKARKREEQRGLMLPSWVNHVFLSSHGGQSSSSAEMAEVMPSDSNHNQQATRVKKNKDSSSKPVKHPAARKNSMSSAQQNHHHDIAGSAIADIVAPSSAHILLVQQQYNQVASTPSNPVVVSGPTAILPTSTSSSNVDRSDNGSNGGKNDGADPCPSSSNADRASSPSINVIDDAFMLYIDQMIHSCNYDDNDDLLSRPYPSKKEENDAALDQHKEETTNAAAATQNDHPGQEEDRDSCA